MSYDLMVFRKDAAPKIHADFMEWYRNQTKWIEGHSYDDPANTSEDLRNWFMEMIKTFPAMNGPFATNDFDNSNVSDYCIGHNVIYVGFAWSVAENARYTMINLAEKYGVGFFDVSSDNPGIFFPENGKLKAIDNPQNKTMTNDSNKTKTGQKDKPWWKLW